MKTKSTTKKCTVDKRKPAAPKNVINVASTTFAAMYYPDANTPAKSLRARLRRMIKTNHDDLQKLLVKHDTYTYAIPNTKTARDKFTAIMS